MLHDDAGDDDAGDDDAGDDEDDADAGDDDDDDIITIRKVLQRTRIIMTL